MVELKHSVQTKDNVDFQRLQKITYMSSKSLKNSPEIKTEFFSLASAILSFVPSLTDNQITPNMV